MAPPSSAPWKKKRAKLLDVLQNANWSKQSQQAANIIKLHKILLVCDANFLDEKSGESPLTQTIGSLAINPHLSNSLGLADSPANLQPTCANPGSAGQTALLNGGPSASLLAPGFPPQSASLFDLQCQSTGLNQHTSISDLSHSQAPLIERLILLFYKCGAQLDFRNKDGRTPLHVAAMKSNFWAINMLLELGAPTDHRDINGLTPLYYSIIYKADLKVTKLLLNHQCSSFATNSNDFSSYSSDARSANPLIQRTPAIGIIDQHGWQETHQACKLGLDAHLEKLLYYGCDINARISGSGNTPLHVAAINDQLECAKVLLMRGADKTITNNSHQTAHQVAVISSNMDLAEFIAEHNESKVIPFRDRPLSCITEPNGGSCVQDQSLTRQAHHQLRQQHLDQAHQSKMQQAAKSSTQLQQTTSISNQSSTRSSLTSSHSLASLSATSGHQIQPRAIVQPQMKYLPTCSTQLTAHMNPLSLDLATANVGSGSLSNNSNSSTFNSSSQPQSLISTGGSSSLTGAVYTSGQQQQQLCAHMNNVSPCLSQRSCATSNTTSSSGVCCDVDGPMAEEAHLYQHLSNSQSQHSNITIINIGDKNTSNTNPVDGLSKESSAFRDIVSSTVAEDEDYDDDLKSSASSLNDGLNSLLFDDRPLRSGTCVEATSDYRSGDPTHLQLHRGDQIEVLECTDELLMGGQLPRLANRPMFYGRIIGTDKNGLFPSFCVQRIRKKRSDCRSNLQKASSDATSHMQTIRKEDSLSQLQSSQNSQTKSIVESKSMMTIDRSGKQSNMIDLDIPHPSNEQETDWKSKFREVQVTLCKINEGFGFVLRGAKVDMTTLASGCNQEQRSPTVREGSTASNKLIIDERLMTANNLISLQYLDEIETGSVAYDAGLKRGDFLVAVNGQDVRLGSHEQVVHMIRQSGNQVHLTIATPIGTGLTEQKQQHHQQLQQVPSQPQQQPQLKQPQPTYTSRTLSRVKPEPPKRDPTTTLTRNRAHRVKSMIVQPQLLMIQKPDQEHRLDPFDANKPLPLAPPSADVTGLASPTGSLNMISRSMSSNLMHFHSAQSLSSTVDTQSISSVSTISADHTQQDQQPFSSSSCSQHATPTQSSSSTATLTTVATAIKPKPPPKTTAAVFAASSIGPSSHDEANVKGLNSTAVHDSAEVENAATGSDSSGADLMNQSTIYQHAVVTTTKRFPQTSLPQAQPMNQIGLAPDEVIKSSKSSTQCSTAPIPPPPPPPPPPPLADPSPKAGYLAQRRTSAPINVNPLAGIDKEVLMKKRESLASISRVGPSSSSSATSQMSAVAAACAAVANNRLQRRQMEQQSEQSTSAASSTADEASLNHPEHKLQVQCQQAPQREVEIIAPPPPLSPAPPVECERANITTDGVDAGTYYLKASDDNTTTVLIPARTQVFKQQLSATLGRKSSAQVIQQPKPNYCSQSQTMRHKPKRLPIPSYDELPPPPAPLPMEDDVSFVKQPLVEVSQQHDIRLNQQVVGHVHSHPHQYNHLHYHQNGPTQQGVYSNHLVDMRPELHQEVASAKRHSHSLVIPQQQQQQQQSVLSQKQHQQIIRQQLIQHHLLQQQQQLQKHQQQMIIQQQIQMQQRDAHRRYESVEHDRHLQHDHLGHQLHNHAHHRLSQGATPQSMLEQQLLHHQIQPHHSHHHHHHNGHHTHNHQAVQSIAPPLKARTLHANHSQHHHHHTHHHNYSAQEHHVQGHRSLYF